MFLCFLTIGGKGQERCDLSKLEKDSIRIHAETRINKYLEIKNSIQDQSMYNLICGYILRSENFDKMLIIDTCGHITANQTCYSGDMILYNLNTQDLVRANELFSKELQPGIYELYWSAWPSGINENMAKMKEEPLWVLFIE